MSRLAGRANFYRHGRGSRRLRCVLALRNQGPCNNRPTNDGVGYSFIQAPMQKGRSRAHAHRLLLAPAQRTTRAAASRCCERPENRRYGNYTAYRQRLSHALPQLGQRLSHALPQLGREHAVRYYRLDRGMANLENAARVRAGHSQSAMAEATDISAGSGVVIGTLSRGSAKSQFITRKT